MFEIPGREIVFYDEIDSTQRPAKEAARLGAPNGCVWTADLQTAGRGRRGRSWQSVRGRDLEFSVILRPRVEARSAPLASLALALAVASAVASFDISGVSLKWPNDVLIDERKVCGIICECAADVRALDWIVAGIGINVSRREDELPASEPDRPRATSMYIARSCRELSRCDVLARALTAIDAEMARLESDEGRADIIERYIKQCSTIGRRVAIITQGERVDATASGIAQSGALIADVGGSLREYDAADVVHIR